MQNAIVWQDRRTQEYCDNLKKNNFENKIRNKTGLFIDPYNAGYSYEGTGDFRDYP